MFQVFKSEDFVRIANELFGVDGWSQSVVSTQLVDVHSEERDGKREWTCCVMMTVRVTRMSSGVSREGVGYAVVCDPRKKQAQVMNRAYRVARNYALRRVLEMFGRRWRTVEQMDGVMDEDGGDTEEGEVELS